MSSVEDILDLLARYNHAGGDWDVEGFVALFAEDGVLKHGGVLRGHDGLREGLPRIMYGTKKHYIGVNHVVCGGGDRAEVRSTLLIVEAETIPAIVATSSLLDEVRRVDGRWLVARRSVTGDPNYRAALPHLAVGQEMET